MNAQKLKPLPALLALGAILWAGGSTTARAQSAGEMPATATTSKSTAAAPAKKGAIVEDAVTKELIETNITVTTGHGGVVNTTTNFTTNVWRMDKGVELSLANNFVQINSGVILLNPYSFTPTNGGGRLGDGDAQAQFFIEFAANYVWAWNYHRRWDWIEAREHATNDRKRWIPFQGHRPISDSYSGEFGIGFPDFSGRINYISQNEDSTSAAAIIGSGEFGMETTLGIPLYQAIDSYSGKLDRTRNAKELYDDTISVHWVGAVFSWSGTTDASTFDIHSRYFAGVGYRAAFKAPWESSGATERREVAVSFQMGGAWVDAVQFKSKQSDEIFTEHNGRPAYKTESCLGVEAEMYIPINKTLNGVVGARFYPISGNDTANSWNAYVGLTVPLSKLSGLLQ